MDGARLIYFMIAGVDFIPLGELPGGVCGGCNRRRAEPLPHPNIIAKMAIVESILVFIFWLSPGREDTVPPCFQSSEMAYRTHRRRRTTRA